ncbi:MAG: putative glycine dehydrogenase (decarboxylating) subunit 2 [Pirellulaceae bacterium]|nr:MAG: putative glycine dehydrogenase (decarboxylating) subunit 2 [Pirellulaceae bacterium]
MRNEQATALLFELSRPGRRAVRFAAPDVAVQTTELLPEWALADKPPPLPEVSESDVVRHFTNLSARNMSVDSHFYPLGSCTMKYNPKRNERLASLPGFSQVHPYQPDSTVQGLLACLFELQEMLAEISGLPGVSLQPAAGAHGELTALLVAAAYFRHRGERRTKVLSPDSAHGTNPASARMAGFTAVTVRSTPSGFVDLDDLRRQLDGQVAVLMITNPNTLGLFDPHIRTIADLVHDVGGLVYLDGANMNAVLGITRPADCGADMMHFNPHKTFSGPHGGGGPGAGPICVRSDLEPFLPVPVVARRNGHYFLDYHRPESIGRVRAFFGNVGVLLRAYCYLLTHGPDGLRKVAENAVLNANYLLARLKRLLACPQGDRCMHEFVLTAEPLRRRGLKQPARDIAKRLLDYGFHAPTVYFPLTVPEALMIEPTETESKETLDAFADALEKILQEPLDLLQEAPHSTPISRPDEVQAARNPKLRWTPD